MNNGKIAAVIGVRKGSERIVNKNIKPFNDTSLLENKIKTLKKVKNLEENRKRWYLNNGRLHPNLEKSKRGEKWRIKIQK